MIRGWRGTATPYHRGGCQQHRVQVRLLVQQRRLGKVEDPAVLDRQHQALAHALGPAERMIPERGRKERGMREMKEAAEKKGGTKFPNARGTNDKANRTETQDPLPPAMYQLQFQSSPRPTAAVG